MLKAPKISLTLMYWIYKINIIWFWWHHNNNGTESILHATKHDSMWHTYSQSCKAVTTVKLHCLISSWLMSHSVRCHTPLISKSPTCTNERSIIKNFNNRLTLLALRIYTNWFSKCLPLLHALWYVNIYAWYLSHFYALYSHWLWNQSLWFQKTKLHL